ncbi:protein tyrosine phosphatase [Acinetobacter sp. ANC 4169]|uniref:low molecular weight protein tyrosine phosphatase family protein n=1 Tax=Acinetobacter sp. ANC 4169 TaxID=1977879 RepID=UPI000A349259|nr:protein tyrosine phosphatase [Acinetobacter sp. ANC 4169]OTG75137.1 protein tyrosine phosphatase [Acinetobacter sp. ANC 4169]
MNILFICSRNQWRSPTAERIFAVGFGLHTRSAGTNKNARHSVSAKDILWSDLIAVMEHKHKYMLQEKFSKELKHKKLIVLDIPDDYQYMDAELIELLQHSMHPYLSHPD